MTGDLRKEEPRNVKECELLKFDTVNVEQRNCCSAICSTVFKEWNTIDTIEVIFGSPAFKPPGIRKVPKNIAYLVCFTTKNHKQEPCGYGK